MSLMWRGLIPLITPVLLSVGQLIYTNKSECLCVSVYVCVWYPYVILYYVLLHLLYYYRCEKEVWYVTLQPTSHGSHFCYSSITFHTNTWLESNEDSLWIIRKDRVIKWYFNKECHDICHRNRLKKDHVKFILQKICIRFDYFTYRT